MIKFINLLDSVSANGESLAKRTENIEKIIITVHTTGSATGTIKVVGGMRSKMPDFSAAQSKDNDWHYLGTIDPDGGAVVAATGVSAAGTDIHRALMVNLDKVQWIGVILSGYSAGAFDVEASVSNQNFI